MSKPAALIVEDSRDVARLLVALLEGEGYAVTEVATGAAAIERARAEPPDLILLDLSLPDSDGVDICRELRTFSNAYLVMVTGRDAEMDKVIGLTVGADDYLTKPFSPAELIARLRAARRRANLSEAGGASADRREFPGLVIDLAAREVEVGGEPVALTKIEFDLLDILSASPRHAVSRRHLLTRVWGAHYGDAHVLDVHMGNLRRKLGQADSGTRLIATVRGVGFRFQPPAG